MGQFDNNSFDLMQERVAALGKVNVYGEKQAEAVQVAVRAIEAHAEGPEAWDAFVKEQNEKGMSIKDASLQLWHLPKDQPEGLFDALYFAKMLMKDESYTRVLECSSRGDKRFSPEFAKVKIGRKEGTIHEFYQDIKRSAVCEPFKNGKRVGQIVDPFTGDKIPEREAAWLYRGLWMTYFSQNPELVKYAEQFNGFSNINSYEGLEGRYNEIIEAYMKGDRERYVSVVKCSDWYKNMERRMSLDERIQAASNQVSDKKSSPCRKQEIDR